MKRSMNRDPAVPTNPALRRRRTDASGFALIEAIVASAIFAMIVLGVLAGIDGAAGSSGREKARSVAGTLAEQDQERMRGMRAVDLSNYAYNRDVTVGGATYNIDSQSDWIRDNTGGTVSCTNSSAQADYMRIRTTVTSSTVGKRTAPVQIDSLVAPPVGAVGSNQGTLAVQVNDRNAVGSPGVPVQITKGAFTMSEVTNSIGCAVFAYIPVGSYDVKVQQAGKVNPAGVNEVHVSGIVSNGTTNVTKVDYDVAGTVTANFRTKYRDPADGSIDDVPSRAWSFMLDNAGVPTTSYRQFLPTVPPASTVIATQLFPFKDAYGLYAGVCRDENPTSGGASQIVDPGQIYTKDVYQPSLRVRVMSNATTPVRNAHVRATLNETSACAGDTMVGVRSNVLAGLTTYGVAGDPKEGYVTRVPVTGFGFDPGIPFGNWTICADNGIRRGTATLDNTVINATGSSPALTTIRLDSAGGGVPGTCP